MYDTVNSMSNLKAFIKRDASQELMYHLRNQIPNKEINTVHYTIMQREVRYFVQKLSTTKVLLSSHAMMCRLSCVKMTV